VNFDDVRDLYQEVILDRGRNPRHMHRMEVFDGKGAGDNPMCGDQVEVRVLFAADGAVADAAFEARGCAISLASADLMAEAVRGLDSARIRVLATSFNMLARTGKLPEEAPELRTLQVLAGVSEYPSRVKCATLPWSALIAALDARREVTHD
jgi:nitrogen fixation NifU-like protein